MKVHIDTPDDQLILGLDAKVMISLGTAENVPTVPIAAVNSDTTGDFVYVVEEGVVVKKYVVTGMTSTEEMEIKNGLQKGEKVITSVDSGIMEGMTVMENAQLDEEGAQTDAVQMDTETALTTETAE